MNLLPSLEILEQDSQFLSNASSLGDEFKPDPVVLARFAAAFENNTAVNKTQLHLHSKLRWNSHSRYIKWLLQKQYVREKVVDEMKCYALTESGMKLLEATTVFLTYLQ